MDKSKQLRGNETALSRKNRQFNWSSIEKRQSVLWYFSTLFRCISVCFFCASICCLWFITSNFFYSKHWQRRLWITHHRTVLLLQTPTARAFLCTAAVTVKQPLSRKLTLVFQNLSSCKLSGKKFPFYSTHPPLTESAQDVFKTVSLFSNGSFSGVSIVIQRLEKYLRPTTGLRTRWDAALERGGLASWS